MLYTIIYKYYFWLKRNIKKRAEDNKDILNVQKQLLGLIESFYNKKVVEKYRNTNSLKSGVDRRQKKKKVIISLTSYPKRISTVWITIETLMRQTVKPDKIILWLAEEQFDGFLSLPKELLDQTKRGLEIRFCDDLRSHKKYYYVMQEFPEELIVLADDDMFYPYDMVEQLLNLHKKYPEDICTTTAQVITEGNPSLPSQWRNPKLGEVWEHSDQIQVFSGSGSLFPPGVLLADAFDKERIKALCPYADDLWLTFMAFQNNRKISTLRKWRAFPIEIYGTAKDSLYYINAEGGQNDEQWKNLMEYY